MEYIINQFSIKVTKKVIFFILVLKLAHDDIFVILVYFLVYVPRNLFFKAENLF